MPRQSVPLSQLLVVCAGFAGGCGEPGPGPDPGSGEPSLAVVGGEQTDTVTAFLPRSLDVRVAGPGDRAAAAVSVSINTIPDPAGRLGVLYLGPGGEAFNYGGGLTDGQGRLSARLRFGGAAGRAGVVVEVQALALADTVYFDVQLGRAAVFPTTGVTDRYENPRNDPVSYQSLTPSLSLAGSTVTATAIDRGRLLVHAGVLTDTVRISVVPAAFLAVGGSGLWFFESDFAGFHRSPVGRGFVEWLPGGLEVLADGVNVSGSWTGDLIAATPAGASRPVLAAIPGILSAWIPRVSRDGRTLYFTAVTGADPAFHFRLWRARLDGTQAEPVPSIPELETTMAAPSPDGRRLAYVALIGSGQIRLLDLEHGVPIPMSVAGHSPRWSPNGTLIAFVAPDEGSALKVMAPDGTGIRTLSEPGTSYDLGLDWSPDGQWIVAKEMTRNRLAFINPTTGMILPLPTSPDAILSPAWRP